MTKQSGNLKQRLKDISALENYSKASPKGEDERIELKKKVDGTYSQIKAGFIRDEKYIALIDGMLNDLENAELKLKIAVQQGIGGAIFLAAAVAVAYATIGIDILALAVLTLYLAISIIFILLSIYHNTRWSKDKKKAREELIEMLSMLEKADSEAFEVVEQHNLQNVPISQNPQS